MTRSSATACWPTSSNAPATLSVSGGSGGCAPSSSCGQPPSARADEAAARHPVRRCTTTTCNGTSPHRRRTRSGSPTSPNTHAEGKLYCCAIKDLFSNRIVGYALDERMTAQLAVTALRTAVARRQPTGVVVHSNRGSQVRARTFRAVLSAAGLQRWMGRLASAGDNAAMSPDTPCCKRTSWTDAAEAPATSPTRRSSSGPSTPTTAGAGNAPSASSPRSRTNSPSPPRPQPLRHDHHSTPCQPTLQQSLLSGRGNAAVSRGMEVTHPCH